MHILKINPLDTPTNFQTNFFIDGFEIEYINLIEVNQGSPLVGNLSINQKIYSNKLQFGGPFLYDKKFLYIPVFIRRFCIVGFKLAKLDLSNLAIQYIGNIEDLIYLNKIENEKIYFYTGIYKHSEKYFFI
ncbi:hypothetical protein [Neisseria zalophi]|uniref:Uncharacterized protein n=1 Tax=Neisseria zalophi TaxID=640030 RepID=A0A5J6PU19_9NEIS|nr:hypothetical protein [Neisseria zalophi]QEY26139.1 hypothetical protein D0T92_06085 [Neisseria zalophi]